MGKKDQRWDDLYGFSNHGNDANYTLPKGYVGCLDDAPNMTGC